MASSGTGQRPRHAVVTGLGAVSPLGVGVAAYLAGLRAGRSGVRRLRLPEEDLARIASSVAAECADWDPRSAVSEADVRRLPRLVPMALAAAREALASAGLAPVPDGDGHADPRRIGLVLGTGAGGIDFTLDQAKLGYAPGATRQPSLWTITNATHGNLAGELSIRLGLRGPSLCVSTGCASSSDAAGLALDLLRSDRPGAPDAVVVVGADAHVRWETLLGMELLGVISTRDFRGAGEADAATASRPFDRSRDGFVLGEGAWAAVLERPAFSAGRGGRAVGRLLGYAATCDAFHRVRPAPDMGESVRAMRLAMDDAGVAPTSVELLHYHGTSTKVNDAAETAAVKRAFEGHAARLRGTSVKGAIGHPQGACGLAALVATLGALANLDGGPGPFVPPTVNLRERDAEGGCDLDYTPTTPGAPASGQPARGDEVALVNCLAFGAKNSALVVAGGG
ncbi:MAG: beta-ketoacyl-[acyl-carrier-protein] synthase family protein [Phycisphaerales bacterium]|nr:beta-ketoacyl-[acyl-carrier-protein] synthase family protein [Phycisphaerales bacterium]